NVDINNIHVTPLSPFTGVYKVSFDTTKGDGEIDISISIEDGNEWGIPSGHEIPFKIKRDTTPPEVSVKGEEDGALYELDKNKKPQYPVLKIEVADKHLDS